MRQHGCEFPWHPLQVLGWSLVFLFCFVYFIWYVPIFVQGWNIAIAIIMGLLLITSTTLGFTVMLSDPSDPSLAQRKGQSETSKVTIPKGKKVIDNNYFCNLCQVQVGKKSKHCKICNKCVSVFDHHCKWLNNCVGDKNYKMFFVYVGTTFAGIILHCAIGLSLVVEYAVDSQRIKDTVEDIYGKLHPVAYISVVAFFVALSLPAIWLLGELFFFHVGLVKKNMTTYEYIMQQRAKYEQKLKENAPSQPKKAFESGPPTQPQLNSLVTNTKVSASHSSELNLNISTIQDTPSIDPGKTPDSTRNLTPKKLPPIKRTENPISATEKETISLPNTIQ